MKLIVKSGCNPYNKIDSLVNRIRLVHEMSTEGRETVYLNSRHIPERAKGMTVVAPAEYAGDGKYPINKFIDFVRDGTDTRQYLAGSGLDMETAINVVAISEAAYESAKSGGRPQAVGFKVRR